MDFSTKIIGNTKPVKLYKMVVLMESYRESECPFKSEHYVVELHLLSQTFGD